VSTTFQAGVKWNGIGSQWAADVALLGKRMLRWFEHRQVYVPSGVMSRDPGELGRPHEDVYFAASDDIRLHGWFFPADPGSPRAHLALLLLHGNGGNICHRLDYCEIWLSLGLNVFVFDYRGYGRSEGRPTEEGTYRDAQAAHTWVRAKGFEPRNIIALGKSLGGGVASELALREPVGSLILQSTFSNIQSVGAELFPWLPVKRFHTIKYDTISKLPRIRVPILVMHSRHDQVIAYHHAERNFAVANDPKMFWEIFGHHTGALEAGASEYAAGLSAFFKKHADNSSAASDVSTKESPKLQIPSSK
jgi:pimeloyl-ACP methyl ester carboxylesterase